MAKPVILTVGDDPEVPWAVGRDTRRRYARDNRVLRAGPGASALENLGKLKLRAGILRTQEAALRNDGRFTDDEKKRIAALQRDVAASGGTMVLLDPLERSDREDEFTGGAAWEASKSRLRATAAA